MVATLCVLALALPVLLGGCGGDGEPAGPTPNGEDGRAAERDAERLYDIAREFCGAFPREELAANLNIRVDPETGRLARSIPAAYAEGRRGRNYEASFDGCLEGMRSRGG